jgi:N,N'-diacetyllegionaminate synthase
MKTIVIAEAGINHNGDIEIAKKLIATAQNAGADYVKFQTYKSENLVSSSLGCALYQEKNAKANQTQYEMLKKLELSYGDFKELHCFCKETGIVFISTPFDLESIQFLNSLDMPFWKIPSGEITNLPYLEMIAKTGKPIIMSTGMAEINEIDVTLALLKKHSVSDISILHCTTEYPAPYKNVNLKFIDTLKRRYGLQVGYSDHTEGIEIPIAAVVMGATIIEKHFTLDKNMPGPDHKASIEPQELKQMIDSIRHVEQAVGDGIKVISETEKRNSCVARKCIVAASLIAKGELYSENNITTKRAGSGLSPMRWYDVIGKRADRDYRKDEPITLDV